MSPQNVGTTGRTQETRSTAQQSTERMKEEVRSAAESQKERATRMAGQQKDKAIDKVNALAAALKASGDCLRQNQEGRIAEYIERASDRLSSYAERMRDRDLQDMLREAKDMARKNPSLFLGGAFAIGFALTRFLKSSQSEAGYGQGAEFSGEHAGQERSTGYMAPGAEPSGAYAGSGLYGGPGYTEAAPTKRPA